MRMAARTRLVGFATASTLLTAACVTVLTVFVDVNPVSLHHYTALGESGPAAVLAVALAVAFFPVVTLLVVALPFGVGAHQVRAGRYDGGSLLAWLVAALAVLPGALLAWMHADTVGLAVAGLVALVALAVALARDDDPLVAVRSSPAQFAHVGLAVLLVAGLYAGAVAGNEVERDLVESGRISIDVPQAAFDVTYTTTDDGRGVVTITHAGGESVPAAELDVRGMRFVEVEGVDQTHVGPWQGETSGPDGQIVEGDSVTVGVEGDCRVRLVYVGAEEQTLSDVTCEDLR